MLAELILGRYIPKQIGQTAAGGTALGSLRTAQVEPLCAEGTRSGRRYTLGNSAAITGLAPVQALPTTTANWCLWNGDAARTYYIEEIGMYLTSGTAGVGGQLLAALFTTPAQTGTTYAGTTISSASNGGLASKMVVKTAVTVTTPAAPNWYPIANNFSPNVGAFPGSGFLEHRNVQGRIAIPPGQGLGLVVLALAGTTPLFAPFATWFEVEADLE